MEKQPFISAIEQICEEKGISKEKVIETIEMAIAAAYKKDYGKKGQSIKVELDSETGKMKVCQVKLVVDEDMIKPEREEGEEEIETEEEEESAEKKVRFNPDKHIMLDEAKKIKKSAKVEDELTFDLKIHDDYGRIAAQTAKQVIIQRIREAEREAIFDEYKEKEGDLVSGVVQRIERGNIFLDIGKATGIIFPEEKIPGEQYRLGQRLRVYIMEVKKNTRGPDIILSRAHPKMASKLFALEVPEISSGTVVIKSIAREPGSRSKIAVESSEEGVDPIGAAIGQKGTRVQAVINELGGEKIDVIEWSKEPTDFIAAALSPAKVTDVEIDKKKNQASVIVPEDQLSLAIGIKGQNVRLAAKLTNWKIDIVSEKDTKAKSKAKKADKEEKPKKEKKDASASKKKKEAKKKEKPKKEKKEKKEVKKKTKKTKKASK